MPTRAPIIPPTMHAFVSVSPPKAHALEKASAQSFAPSVDHKTAKRVSRGSSDVPSAGGVH